MKKMLIYISIDGQMYQGNTARDIVIAMRATSFDGVNLTLPQFMRRVASTATVWTKRPIRTNKPEAFIKDLVETKMLKRFDNLKRPAGDGEQDF